MTPSYPWWKIRSFPFQPQISLTLISIIWSIYTSCGWTFDGALLLEWYNVKWKIPCCTFMNIYIWLNTNKNACYLLHNLESRFLEVLCINCIYMLCLWLIPYEFTMEKEYQVETFLNHFLPICEWLQFLHTLSFSNDSQIFSAWKEPLNKFENGNEMFSNVNLQQYFYKLQIINAEKQFLLCTQSFKLIHN